MPMYYTPKVLLRQVPNGLLRDYFVDQRNQLLDIPWGRLRETDVEPIHEAILGLPEADRREIGGHFRAVAEMAKREFTPWLIHVAREQGAISPRSVPGLPLALLMSGVAAQHPDHPRTPDDLALLAHDFD